MITKSLLVFNASIILLILISFPEGLQAGTFYECKNQIGTIVLSDIPLGKGYNCKPLDFFRDITNEDRKPREKEKDKEWKAKQEKKESAKHEPVKEVQTEKPLIDLKDIAFKVAGAEWGTIMYPKHNTNIRAKRSVVSALQGQLKTDQPVKVDFLQDGWYAVFPVTHKQRDEKMALGYVYASLLIDKQSPNSAGSTTSEEKSASYAPVKEVETERQLIDVKNIAFKVAGDGKELLLIEFDRFYTPVISGIEGREPKIILEIKNASSLKEDWAAINTGGNFIQQIHSSMDSQTGSAFITLDMAPEKDYFISQAFYEKENVYALEISDEKKIRLP